LVKLVGSGSVRRGRDKPFFELVSKVWPVGILPVWSRFAIMGEGGRMEIKIGVWSHPVEGRDDASQA